MELTGRSFLKLLDFTAEEIENITVGKVNVDVVDENKTVTET